MALESHTVPANISTIRADKFLAVVYPETSRTRLQRFFDNDEVLHDGEPIFKSFALKAGDTIECPHPDTLIKPIDARKVAFDILYEDKDFFAINKQVGMAVHPVSMDDEETTIAHGVLDYLGEKVRKIGAPERPCIVHRLDRETSGVLLIAKTAKAYEALKELFAAREIQKLYLAIVRGCPDLLAGSCTAPLGRSPRNPLKQVIMEEGTGKHARTDWDRLAVDLEAKVALVRCELHTGRTHQARVHLSHLGYQGLYKGRILLHSHTASFKHPITGKPMKIEAPIPKDFLAFKGLWPKKAKK